MVAWALGFFVLALFAAVLGFTGLAGMMATIAKWAFFMVLALLLASALIGAIRGTRVICWLWRHDLAFPGGRCQNCGKEFQP